MLHEQNPECSSCQAREKNIFCRLETALVRHLSSSKTSRIYHKKQALYYEGAPTQGLFCIHSGSAKIFKTGLQGRQLILRMAQAGDVIALEDIFYNKHYTASAEMIEEGKVCFIDKAILMDIIRKDLNTALTVMKALASEIIASEEERVDLAQNSVRERMARLLSVLSESHGTPAGKNVMIQMPLSREEMAEMIGTASETAMRLLKEFRDENVLKVEGRKIVVLDRDKLRKTARMAV